MTSPTPTPEREPDIHREYRGEKVRLMNINWTKNLDKAWQCNWQKTYSRCESTYGSSPDEAFDSMKTLIDLFLLKEPEISPVPTPESRLREAVDSWLHDGENGLPSPLSPEEEESLKAFIGRLLSQEREELVRIVEEFIDQNDDGMWSGRETAEHIIALLKNRG